MNRVPRTLMMLTFCGLLAVFLATDHADHLYASPAAQTAIEGVPVCTDHNTTVWHPLVQKDAGGTITCTYGHEHHADPNSVNDIFGPPSAWYGGTQAISYPWQTGTAPALENVAKHEGYKWFVQRDMLCKPAWPAPNDGCFRAWRVQVHSMGTASDAVARFHSFSFEALIEYHGQQGIVRHGGHLDIGHLALLGAGGAAANSICPPLPTNPPTFACAKNNHRIHSAANTPPPHKPGLASHAGWYANHQITGLSATVEEWGPIDYPNPPNQLYHKPELRGNGSRSDVGNMSAALQQPWFTPGVPLPPVLTWSGYTTANGDPPPPGCAAPSVTCVPLKIEHATPQRYIWNNGIQGMPPPPEFDVVSPTTGKSLIVYPN